MHKRADGSRVELLVGKMKVVSSIDRLEYVGPVKSKPPVSSHRISANMSSTLSEVNLIGLQVDEGS